MSANECDRCADCLPRRAFLTQVSGSLVAGMLLPALAAASELRYPIPSADGATIDKKGQVIIVREQQDVFAFNLACPHENTALKWRDKDHRFQCPKHDSKYTPDGTFKDGRATRNMDRFALRREGGEIVVDVNRLYRSDQQPKEWTEAVVRL
jgi:nitrite reductase/ring-hydroxylating ferredoxin subunit